MSSSLFYDCYASYEMSAKTEYFDGDKKFSDIVENDILYRLCIGSKCDANGYIIQELKVTKPFHSAHGHYYISVEGKLHAINFGPTDCVNSKENAKDSVIYSNDGTIGTNKISVITAKRRKIEKEIENAKNQLVRLEYDLNDLNSIEI
jgi:hypothetical protein